MTPLEKALARLLEDCLTLKRYSDAFDYDKTSVLLAPHIERAVRAATREAYWLPTYDVDAALAAFAEALDVDKT